MAGDATEILLKKAKQFEQEFNEDLAVIAFAIKKYGLPPTLKLSVHSGSDKFSIYEAMRKLAQAPRPDREAFFRLRGEDGASSLRDPTRGISVPIQKSHCGQRQVPYAARLRKSRHLLHD